MRYKPIRRPSISILRVSIDLQHHPLIKRQDSPSGRASSRNMAQKEAAAALANLLSKVARYSVLLGIGGSAVQASLYTGM